MTDALTASPFLGTPSIGAPSRPAPLDEAAAAGLARTFKALGDPTRLRLLSLIATHPGQEACVCDLTDPVGLSQPTVSHHLKILVDAGLLTRDKRGVWAFYALVPGALPALGEALSTTTAHQGRSVSPSA